MVKQIKGWYFPDSDTHFEEWLERGKGEYQQIQRSNILNHIKKTGRTNTCIDVGAHVGLWTRELSQVFKYVYAFEPMPHHRECFEKNVKKYNVKLLPFALGDFTGKVEFKIDKENTGNCHIVENYDKRKGQFKQKELDNFKFDKLDYIKIDAEGHEKEVLEGAVETLEKHKPFVSVEIKEKILEKVGKSRNQLEQQLKDSDYELILASGCEHLYGRK
jgi:FkbM family methyltransferase